MTPRSALIECRDALRGANTLLTVAAVSSCTCNVKSPALMYHDAGCRYRLICEAMDGVDSVLVTLAAAEQQAEPVASMTPSVALLTAAAGFLVQGGLHRVRVGDRMMTREDVSADLRTFAAAIDDAPPPVPADRAAMIAARDALADALEGYAFNEHDTSVYGAALSLLSAAIDAAPAGDPVAWLFVYANPAMNWASTKPPPAPETGQPWTSAPLYLHPVPTVDADAVRRAALEEAAQVADDKAQLIEDGLDDVQLGDEPMAYASAFTCRAVRDAIRALATPAPVTPGSISAPALNQTAGSVEGDQP